MATVGLSELTALQCADIAGSTAVNIAKDMLSPPAMPVEIAHDNCSSHGLGSLPVLRRPHTRVSYRSARVATDRFASSTSASNGAVLDGEGTFPETGSSDLLLASAGRDPGIFG